MTRTASFDIGGSKIEIARVAADGTISQPRHAADAAYGLERFRRRGRRAGRGRSAAPTGSASRSPARPTRRPASPIAANVPAITGHRIAEELAERLGVPVTVGNDADCFALAEAMVGAGRGLPVVFGAIFGTGVGGGLVVNGRLVRGAHGVTGEWGHGPILADAVRARGIPLVACGCGQLGCLDVYGSARGMERIHHGLHGDELGSHAITEAWHAGDARAAATIDTFVELITGPLSMIVNTLGPSLIPAGGGLLLGCGADRPHRRLGAHQGARPLRAAAGRPRPDARRQRPDRRRHAGGRNGRTGMTVMLEVCIDTAEGLAAARRRRRPDRALQRARARRADALAGPDDARRPRAGPRLCDDPPREGDFVFAPADLDQMRRDIDAVRDAGLAGVVLGASEPRGALDGEALARLVAHAEGLGTTLHRAFDLVPDPLADLELAIGLGFERVLTSGGAERAEEALDAIAALVSAAGDRISIMPGGGARPENAALIVAATGCARNPRLLPHGGTAGAPRRRDARLRARRRPLRHLGREGGGDEGRAFPARKKGDTPPRDRTRSVPRSDQRGRSWQKFQQARSLTRPRPPWQFEPG